VRKLLIERYSAVAKSCPRLLYRVLGMMPRFVPVKFSLLTVKPKPSCCVLTRGKFATRTKKETRLKKETNLLTEVSDIIHLIR